jgi:nicotinamide-nucleotide amidase
MRTELFPGVKNILSYKLAEKLGNILLASKLYCAVAESCTGGGLAAAITDIPGSSQWFDRGFVTYTNEAKIEMLAVPASMISSHGAVSEATVLAMAQGAILHSHAQVSAAISGVAGPGGGSVEKPVGTVWIAWAGAGNAAAQCYLFEGGRIAIREQAVLAALEGLIKRCEI